MVSSLVSDNLVYCIAYACRKRWDLRDRSLVSNSFLRTSFNGVFVPIAAIARNYKNSLFFRTGKSCGCACLRQFPFGTTDDGVDAIKTLMRISVHNYAR